MKFDSYTRFLKSQLYQECILAEVEGRPLPDPQQVPSSPASKHSVSSDHSNVSTPKKVPRPCRRRLRAGSSVGRTPVRVSVPSPTVSPRPWGRGPSRTCLPVGWAWGPALRDPRSTLQLTFSFLCISCHFKVTVHDFNDVFHWMTVEWKIKVWKIPE